MPEYGGVDGRDGVLQIMRFQHPRMEHEGVEIGEGDHRSAGSDDSQQRARCVASSQDAPLTVFTGEEASREASKLRWPGVAGASSSPNRVESAGWWWMT